MVLVLEDAHNADPALLDFLDYWWTGRHDSPLFVVVLARPEIATKRPGFGLGRNRTPLSLAPLDAEAMGALLEGLVPGLPSSAASKVAGSGSRSAAVRRRDGAVPGRPRRARLGPGKGYKVAGELGTLVVPDSLHGLLAARLDALDQDVRSLVADASVLGRSFSAEALVAVSGLAESERASRVSRAGRARGTPGLCRQAVTTAGRLPVRSGNVATGRLVDTLA